MPGSQPPGAGRRIMHSPPPHLFHVKHSRRPGLPGRRRMRGPRHAAADAGWGKRSARPAAAVCRCLRDAGTSPVSRLLGGLHSVGFGTALCRGARSSSGPVRSCVRFFRSNVHLSLASHAGCPEVGAGPLPRVRRGLCCGCPVLFVGSWSPMPSEQWVSRFVSRFIHREADRLATADMRLVRSPLAGSSGQWVSRSLASALMCLPGGLAVSVPVCFVGVPFFSRVSRSFSRLLVRTAVCRPGDFAASVAVCFVGVPFFLRPARSLLAASSKQWVSRSSAFRSSGSAPPFWKQREPSPSRFRIFPPVVCLPLAPTGGVPAPPGSAPWQRSRCRLPGLAGEACAAHELRMPCSASCWAGRRACI